MPSLLQRLKERKLFQWSLAYLAGAWLVFQGIEVLAEPWNLSGAVQRSIHVLLGVGFFVTLILSCTLSAARPTLEPGWVTVVRLRATRGSPSYCSRR